MELVRQAMQAAIGHSLDPAPLDRVAGGSINECVRWRGEGDDLFVKLAAAKQLDMFEAEAAGLRELAGADALRVPEVLSVGAAGTRAWLALCWIDFGASDRRSEAALGERLATLHRVAAPCFGWHRDNTIGATPQRNGWDDDWVRFFVGHRLEVQLGLAEVNGAPVHLIERGRWLCQLAGALFSSYQPMPSLLHGDLWGGNWATDAAGEPVVFDPAVYFGDREADIAMTRLFGGFGPRFLFGVPVRLAARCCGGDSPNALQPVSRAEPLQPVRRRLCRAGRSDDRAPPGRPRSLSGVCRHGREVCGGLSLPTEWSRHPSHRTPTRRRSSR